MKILVKSKWATDSKSIFPENLLVVTSPFCISIFPLWRIKPQHTAWTSGISCLSFWPGPLPCQQWGFPPCPPLPIQGTPLLRGLPWGGPHTFSLKEARPPAVKAGPAGRHHHPGFRTKHLRTPLLPRYSHFFPWLSPRSCPASPVKTNPTGEASQILLFSYILLAPVFINLTPHNVPTVRLTVGTHTYFFLHSSTFRALAAFSPQVHKQNKSEKTDLTHSVGGFPFSSCTLFTPPFSWVGPRLALPFLSLPPDLQNWKRTILSIKERI